MGPRTGRIVQRKISNLEDATVSRVRLWLSDLIESIPYQVALAILIVCNMGIVIHETDLRAQGQPNVPWIDGSTLICLVIYSIDLMLRVYVQRSKFPKSFMNIFDSFIVLMDILLVVFSNTVGDLPSFSVLRCLRMLRIVRVFRQFLMFRELYLMVHGLVSAIRAIAFGSLMMVAVLTMWSIMAVEVVQPVNVQLADEGTYGDCLRCGRAFESVMSSNLTFLMNIVSGDSWGVLSVPIMERDPWAAIIIMGAFISLELGLMNVIAAVIVDRQSQARQDDEELLRTVQKEELESSYKRLQTLFELMDEDGSGSLSHEELLESYQTHDDFREILHLMDINESDLANVFDILDKDGSGDVTYLEFVEQLHTMKTKDAHTLLIFIQHKTDKILDALNQLISTSRPKPVGRFSTILNDADDEDMPPCPPLVPMEPKRSSTFGLLQSDASSIEEAVLAELQHMRLSIGRDIKRHVVAGAVRRLSIPAPEAMAEPHDKATNSSNAACRHCLHPATAADEQACDPRGSVTPASDLESLLSVRYASEDIAKHDRDNETEGATDVIF